MERRHLAVAIALVAVVNGIFSPVLLLLLALAPVWMPDLLPRTGPVMFYASSLLLSALTVMLSGVPAAIYERARGLKDSDGTSLTIWLGGAVLLTLPALLTAMRM